MYEIEDAYGSVQVVNSLLEGMRMMRAMPGAARMTCLADDDGDWEKWVIKSIEGVTHQYISPEGETYNEFDFEGVIDNLQEAHDIASQN